MRPSPLRHPVAVLRQIIGLSQKELADLVGRSRRTIQAVELGSLELSQALAFDISACTGINVAWLLTGEPDATPVNLEYKVYSKADFELVQTQGLIPSEKLWSTKSLVHFDRLSRAQMILAPLAMAVAVAMEKKQEGIAIYRVHEVIRSLSKEFGWASEELLQYAKKCRLWVENPEGYKSAWCGGMLFDDPRGKEIPVFAPREDENV